MKNLWLYVALGVAAYYIIKNMQPAAGAVTVLPPMPTTDPTLPTLPETAYAAATIPPLKPSLQGFKGCGLSGLAANQCGLKRLGACKCHGG